MTQEHKIITVHREDEAAAPTFSEVVFSGAFNDALNHVVSLAKNAKFMMGQVLKMDGKVQATVAPQGSVHLSGE